MHPYKKGRRFEYKVKKELEEQGYYVIRSAGSRGVFDLIAIKWDEVLGIQCKLGKVSEKEIKEMFEVGSKYGIIPVIVTKDGTKVIMHRTPSDEIEYKKPIVLNALYDPSDDTWNLSNEELGIYGYGFSIDVALLDAEICLLTLIKNDKNKLKEYVEVI